MRTLGVCLPLLFAGLLVIGAASANGAQRPKPQNQGIWLFVQALNACCQLVNR